MPNFSLSAFQFPTTDFQQVATNFSNYVSSMSVEARVVLGQALINSSSSPTNGSPQSEFVNESLRWTGQSLIDGQWNSAPLNLSSAAVAAAAVEFGSDALIGAAIGLGVAAAFWALPVAAILPGSILGGYLAGQFAAISPLIPLLAPFLGKIARGWALDWLKNHLGVDLHDYINDLYGQAGHWIADNLIDPLAQLLRDPLVLDLDGDGIEVTPLDGSSVHFDYDGDGFAERTGWVSADDGMLVIDDNGNGLVDGAAELFGSPTQDGFAVLETLDTNHDGVITAQDAAFAKLRVWRDLNQNGVSEAGELQTLAEAGIASISLQRTDLPGTAEGHTVGYGGSFTRPARRCAPTLLAA